MVSHSAALAKAQQKGPSGASSREGIRAASMVLLPQNLINFVCPHKYIIPIGANHGSADSFRF